MEKKQDNTLELLASRTGKSLEAFQKAKTVIPSGVMSRPRLFRPYPFFVKYGKGSKIVDLDGNEYIDCSMGYGPLMLGHAPDPVVKATQEAVARGSQFAIPHELEFELAKIIQEAVPCADKVSFCNVGSEATFHALRMARGKTGKMKVAKFEGGYHGIFDTFCASVLFDVSKAGSMENPIPVPSSIGIPPRVFEDVIVLPFNHPAAFDIIKKNKEDIAVVMVEGMQGVGGNIPAKKEFLQDLRKVTRECNILLMFDEIITGFRLAWGGAQEYFGVTPDFATYGKIIGGGLPVAAVAGRNDIMDMIAYTGERAVDATQKVFYGGTFNGNLVCVASGLAMLTTLKQKKDHLYDYINRQGDRLRNEVNQFCQQNGMDARVTGIGSTFFTHFTKKEIHSTRDLAGQNLEARGAFYPHLLKNGVFIPDVHLGFLSAAHSEKDVDAVIQAHKKALMELRELGLI
jgi:glutamate-1-semialdehyde 2,1-aminomutase